jgi:hypothetical protein
MKFSSKLASLMLLGVMASTASAVIDSGNIQWPEAGATISNGADVNVYTRVSKEACTGVCDPAIVPCEDIVGSFYYRAEGETEFLMDPLTFNDANCYTPSEEYFGLLPMAALTGSIVEFYVEYYDTTDDSYFYPGDYNAELPAFYNISNSTTAEFTYSVCVDMHCLSTMAPGFSGTFNGWTFGALVETPVDSDIWCGDIVVPIGSDPVIQFKFRNSDAWEDAIGNRSYEIAPGATSDSATFFWNDNECSGPTELLADLMVIFTLDMTHQDAATYAGGASIQGGTDPLNWTPGANLMTYHEEEDNFTIGLTFLAGTNTSAAFKFTRSADGVGFDWEGVSNRSLFLDESGGPVLTLPANYWDDFTPPTVTTVDVEVTFSVLMDCQDEASYAGGVSIQGGVDPLNWDAGSTLLTDMDGHYETTLLFPAGSPLNLDYKFTRSADGMEWGWEDGIDNRPLILDDATPVMVLEHSYWDNYVCPAVASITAAGSDLTLTWTLVPGAESYNIYLTDSAYAGEAVLLENVALPPYNTVVEGLRGFYTVRAVFAD